MNTVALFPDRLDEMIADFLKYNPYAPYDVIARALGRSRSEIAHRCNNYRDPDWVERTRAEIAAFVPEALDAIDAGLSDEAPVVPRAKLALDIFKGLGVITDKQKVEINFADATEEQVIAWLQRQSSATLDRVIALAPKEIEAAVVMPSPVGTNGNGSAGS